MREEQNENLYLELPDDFLFSGLSVETLDPEAKKMVSLLAKLLQKKIDEPSTHEFLKQCISMCLQRGNARCILGTFKELEVWKKFFTHFFVKMSWRYD